MKTFEEKPGAFDDLKIAYASRSDHELKKMYWLFRMLNNNTVVHIGAKLTEVAIQLHLPINWLMKKTMFGHFCGGETIEDCMKNIENLAQYAIKTILDYSVEGKGTEDSFDATMEEILKTIHTSGKDANVPFAAIKVTGLGDYSILKKIQEGQKLDQKEQVAFENLKGRVDLLCKAAYDSGTKILIDAEDSWYQHALDEMVYAAMEKYNQEKCVVFNTYQMYRHDMLDRLKAAFRVARDKEYFLGAKLVRGAYMEKERNRALTMNYPSPIQPNKLSTDRDYDLGLTFCIENIDRLELFSGSHNENSNYYLGQLIDLYGLKRNDARIYFAQLFGMSDHITFNLAKEGFNVVKYVPYGPVEKVIPYLIRRAEENTSVAGQSSRELQLIRKEMRRRK